MGEFVNGQQEALRLYPNGNGSNHHNPLVAAGDQQRRGKVQ
jgi:hypothetical protein